MRHGESEWNAEGNARAGQQYEMKGDETPYQAEGVPDHLVPLTEKGHTQALATGVGLREKYGVLDVIYHSGYLRAKQTTEDVLKAYSEEERKKIKIREHARLRERESGYKFFMAEGQMDKLMPYYRGYFNTVGPFFASPPGGESHCQVCERVDPMIHEIFELRDKLKVACIVHSGTKRALRYNLEKWTREKYEAEYAKNGSTPNCGVTEYNFNPTNGRLELGAVRQLFYPH